MEDRINNFKLKKDAGNLNKVWSYANIFYEFMLLIPSSINFAYKIIKYKIQE